MKIASVQDWSLPLRCSLTADVSAAPPSTHLQLRVKAVRVALHCAGASWAPALHRRPNGAATAEHANVLNCDLVLLPSASCGPVAVAALVNPVSSCWMALCRRVISGLTVLILAVTSTIGWAGAQVARFLSDARVLGVSRSIVEGVGVDEHVLLPPSDQRLNISGLGRVHVILDYMGGTRARHMLETVVNTV
ncbi:hypothetical protein PgNI_10168 [Pyricularia grisea]|uniref:Uncharacterized protein n=1 Tax=Pyricularia grisea TaxID=148305 RepID=A0A6P8AYD8_PYRGI|nr:hypothetical protein PgNI_10168 [Pyricularia grisea]TLD07352.1 hypothetical protein PgNI_10168 [Pyricularia grisea]